MSHNTFCKRCLAQQIGRPLVITAYCDCSDDQHLCMAHLTNWKPPPLCPHCKCKSGEEHAPSCPVFAAAILALTHQSWYAHWPCQRCGQHVGANRMPICRACQEEAKAAVALAASLAVLGRPKPPPPAPPSKFTPFMVRSNGNVRLYACLGDGRGCKRNRFRTVKVACDDCLAALEKETVAELMERADSRLRGEQSAGD